MITSSGAFTSAETSNDNDEVRWRIVGTIAAIDGHDYDHRHSRLLLSRQRLPGARFARFRNGKVANRNNREEQQLCQTTSKDDARRVNSLRNEPIDGKEKEVTACFA
ncbi:hypothetical protein EAG_10850 [Camponotus floridanus]|uniref:Uncharacterized protein n=1 Tax=Camponotus floridanus TaxID=104421 RepID=E2A9J8_CAMFO|nr:hypothetical protein EAG_10850 [Camponotus floridanus]